MQRVRNGEVWRGECGRGQPRVEREDVPVRGEDVAEVRDQRACCRAVQWRGVLVDVVWGQEDVGVRRAEERYAELVTGAEDERVDVVQRAAEGAAKQYAEISGRTVKVSVQGSLSNDM